MREMDTRLPLVLADESAVGSFVTSGLLRLPGDGIRKASDCILSIKIRNQIPPDTRLHCRVMFAPHSKKNSDFRHLKVDELHQLLLDCVYQMNLLGASWWGAFVDKTKYPKTLRSSIEGKPFEVTNKHLAGLVFSAGIFNMEHALGTDYQLAFDPDPTKIDWGFVKSVQATHFARINERATKLDNLNLSLLEMADIAAYALAQGKEHEHEPGNRKGRRYLNLARAMPMRAAEFQWMPEDSHPKP
jgi:hypothetical protein